MNELRILDLFSGIGGFSYAAEKLVGGFKTVAFCEQDEFAQMVLKKHWKDIPIYEDVRTIDATRLGTIDIVCGGFPCQAVSQAGLQKGDEDERWLWDEMFRVVQDCKPKYVIGENVRGLISIREGFLFEKVQSDLESEGYEVQSFIIPAASVGAWHLRERVWILARRASNANGINDTIGRVNRDVSKVSRSGQVNSSGSGTDVRGEFEPSKDGQMVSNTFDKGSQRGISRGKIQRRKATQHNIGHSSSIHGQSKEREKTTPCRMGNLDDGIPAGLFDHFKKEPEGVPRLAEKQEYRSGKLKCLGNSVVPQVVAELFIAIKHSEGFDD